MADVMVCTSCGSRVPVGRAMCGRCGADAPRAAVAHTDGRSSTPGRLAAAGAAVVVCGIAVAVLAGSKGEPSLVPPTTAAVPRGRPTPPGRGRDFLVPAREFAAVDASRSGVAAYTAGDLAAAITQFTVAAEADPNNADALNNLGQALVKAGRAREAIPYFDRAIVASESVWAYHFNRARAYAELKEWGQAVAGYTDAARLFPDDYVTQFNLAKARQADGDLAGAVQGYARAVELAPGQADFHLWYGQALDGSGRPVEAAAAYRRFLELEPQASQAEKVKARLAQLDNGAAGVPLKSP